MLHTLTRMIVLCFLILANAQSAASRTISIGVLGGDAQAGDTEAVISALFEQEITALFAGEFETEFLHYALPAEASADEINAILDDAYAEPQLDYVLVLDFAANQMLGYRDHYIKPTFLPLVLNAQLLGYPEQGGTSGRKNLQYISQNIDLAVELSALRTVADFGHAALLADVTMATKIHESMQTGLVAQARAAGVQLSIIPFDGDPARSDPAATIAALPATVDAVLYGVYPSADAATMQRLIDEVNAAGYPSFSLASEQHVRMGALATNSPDTDWTRLARHIAIFLQETVLGTPVERLSVRFDTNSRLLINMATSRDIRISPSFDVLSEAALLHEDAEPAARTYSLTRVARDAVAANLHLVMQKVRQRQSREQHKIALANRHPQITGSVAYMRRRATDQTRSGLMAKASTDAAVTVTMPLFSDAVAAAVTIAELNILSSEAMTDQVRLDIIKQAVHAYLEVLRAQTSVAQKRVNLGITRKNYQLAQTRVNVGDSSKSDLFRWESELANVKQALLQENAVLKAHRHALNRVLNRPLDEDFETTIETLDNPDLLVSDQRFVALIENQYALDRLTAFFVDLGVTRAAALRQAQTQIDIAQRAAVRDARAVWQPDLHVTARYGRNLAETRAAGARAEKNDWTIGLEMSLPLYDGGLRAARTAQSELAVAEAMTNLRDIRQTVEQQIRSHAEQSYASYRSIALARLAETAASQNYELVEESYAAGQAAITDLLDAQGLLIDASEASLNATHWFLLDLMALQHATGAFDFFLTDSQRLQLSADLLARLAAE